MGYQIIEKPGTGMYNVFSSVSDKFIFKELATEAEVIEHFVNDAKEDAERRVTGVLEKLKKGENPYYQFAKTWDEAWARHNREDEEDDNDTEVQTPAL